MPEMGSVAVGEFFVCAVAAAAFPRAFQVFSTTYVALPRARCLLTFRRGSSPGLPAHSLAVRPAVCPADGLLMPSGQSRSRREVTHLTHPPGHC